MEGLRLMTTYNLSHNISNFNFSNNMSLLYNDSLQELLKNPEVLITTWPEFNKVIAVVFILGMVIGYGICFLRNRDRIRKED